MLTLTTKFKNRGLVLSIAALLASRFAVIWLAPINLLDQLIPDDSWMYLSLAESVSAGLGPQYHGDLTNGFQPLFLFVLSTIWSICSPENFTAIRVSLTIGAISELICIVALLCLIDSAKINTKIKIWIIISWTINPYAFVCTLNGLETSLACATSLLAICIFIKSGVVEGRCKVMTCLFVGALFGLASLARIDALILAAIVLVFSLVRQLKTKKQKWLFKIAALGFGMAIVFMPWPIWSRVNFGYWLPISGSATRFQSLFLVAHKPTIENWYLPMISTTYTTILLNNLGLLIVGYIGYRLSGRNLFLRVKFFGSAYRDTLHIIFLWCISLYLAYTFYVFGPWYFERYYFPTLPLIILLIVPTIKYLSYSLSSHHWRLFSLSTYLIILLAGVIQWQIPGWLGNKLPSVTHYIPSAEWVQKKVPQGAVIGAVQSGAIGFLVRDKQIVNLDGKLDADVLDALVNGRAMEYARRAGVTHIVGWPSNIEYVLHHSEPNSILSLKMLMQKEIDNRPWQIWQVITD
jgi:hypothetical protein